MKLAVRKSALNPRGSTDRSKAVTPVLVLLFVALWFILRGDLFCLALCYFVIVFFSPLALRFPRLGKRELILVLFVRLFYLRLFAFVSSSSWCLGGAAACDCGTPGLFSYLSWNSLAACVCLRVRLPQRNNYVTAHSINRF